MIFRAQGDTQISAVIRVLALYAVGGDGLTVWFPVDIAPSAFLAQSHTDMLSNLRKPDNSIDDGAKTNTRPISRLISILVVRALFHALVGAVLPEQPRHSRAFDDANG